MGIKRNYATFRQQGKVGTVAIQNAGRLNLLDSDVITDLIEVLQEAATIDTINSLVFRGAGDEAFIAGAHIEEMSRLDVQSARVFIRRLKGLCEALDTFPVPVIARIPGWCLGAGLEIAMACDLRVISQKSQLGMPEVKVGIPSVIHAALLPKYIGNTHANWLLLSGEMINAQQAMAWGLANFCEPVEEIDNCITAITDKFSALGPKVIRQQKALIRHWRDIPTTQAIEDSVDSFGQAFETGEPEQYMRAFLAKNKR